MINRERATGIGAVLVIAAILFTGFIVFEVVIGPTFYAANQLANANALVTVSSTCEIALSPNTVNFGTLGPSQSAATQFGVNDLNNGNVGTNIWVQGQGGGIYIGNWLDTTDNAINFPVSNTKWDVTLDAIYTGNSLTDIATNTNIGVASLATSQVFWGVTIPNGQTAATYVQNILITNVC